MEFWPLDSCRLFTCAACHSLVFICRACDRGNIYCGKPCATKARRLHHRKSNQRYGRSRKGLFSSAARSKRYRSKQRIEKNVTDQGSRPQSANAPLTTNPEPTLVLGDSGDIRIKSVSFSPVCTLCKVPVGTWMRTGYLRSEPDIRLDQRRSHRDHRKRTRRNH